jgi:hypothetical protein
MELVIAGPLVGFFYVPLSDVGYCRHRHSGGGVIFLSYFPHVPFARPELSSRLVSSDVPFVACSEGPLLSGTFETLNHV